MTTINTDFVVGFNNIVNQLKQRKDKVTPEEWNAMWNVLSTQANQNAQFLSDLKNFIIGEGSGQIEIPDNYQSIFELINNLVVSWGISIQEPTDTNVMLWYKVLPESTSVTPPPTTVIFGGNFDEVPVDQLLGGSFEVVPEYQLLGGNY